MSETRLTMEELYEEDKALQLLFGVSFNRIRHWQIEQRQKGLNPTEYVLPPLKEASVYGLKLVSAMELPKPPGERKR